MDTENIIDNTGDKVKNTVQDIAVSKATRINDVETVICRSGLVLLLALRFTIAAFSPNKQVMIRKPATAVINTYMP